MSTFLPTRRAVVTLTCIVLSTGPWCTAQGATSQSWSDVLALRASQRITIAVDGRSSFDAVVQGADDSSVTVIAYGGTGAPERLPRAAIQRITTLTPNPQRKRAGWFVAAGLGALTIGAALKNPEGGPSAGFWIGLPLLGIGTFGWNQANQHPVVVTIYRRT
jgi:hypothetical protein